MSNQKSGGYKDLLVWQKSVDLVVRVYELVKKIPQNEMFGLTPQIKRSAVSILSNIAEGQARKSKKEFINSKD